MRHDVAVAQNLAQIRALVARPDLTSGEASSAMSEALATIVLDPSHVAFLRELVFGAASVTSRPVLAVAVVRGLLSRVDSLLAQHPLELARNRAALDEIARAYALVEDVVGADERDNVTRSARADCAHALKDHIARNAAMLRPDSPVPMAVAAARAQAAIALLDALSASPVRRVDAAEALGLEGPRRAVLVQLGVLVLDSGGSDGAAPSVRAPLERLPGARAAVEAIFVGDESGPLRGRDGLVLVLAHPPSTATEANCPWGDDPGGLAIASTTTAAARALASIAVDRALERRPELRLRIERDGGQAGVAKLAAMLVLDAPRTLDRAAAHWSEGESETAAWLVDALGALAGFAPAAAAPEGVVLSVGGSGGGAAAASHVTFDEAGAANGFRIGAHSWRATRGASGKMESLRRDGTAVEGRTLAGAEPALSAGPWRGGGLVFARLAGAPRASVVAGPRIRLVGSGVNDAIATPALADDVVVDADLRVDGAPAGVVVRAVPTANGFKGVSVVVVPGAPPQARLVVSDGGGVETVVASGVTLANTPTQRLHLMAKGRLVEGTLGTAKLSTTVSDDFAHGDVALRASAGATLEATGWRLARP